MNPVMEQHNAAVRARLARLGPMDGSTAFFARLKTESEQFWKHAVIDKALYGFQVQPGTCWNRGLDEAALDAFEKAAGFPFPEILRNYFRVMNGTDKPQVNIYGESGHPYAYHASYNAWPGGMDTIREYIHWICEAWQVDPATLTEKNISRIFPVVGHRFLMIDIPGHPVLSMHGEDVIFWAHDLCALLLEDIFGAEIALFPSPDETPVVQAPPVIPFWID